MGLETLLVELCTGPLCANHRTNIFSTGRSIQQLHSIQLYRKNCMKFKALFANPTREKEYFIPKLRLVHKLYYSVYYSCFRYGRWVTRRVALVSIATIWLLAALISFVPISLGLHRPPQPLVYNAGGQNFPTCALDLTPTYAVVSSCISFYVPCIVMIGESQLHL